jgi:hypothetical protein
MRGGLELSLGWLDHDASVVGASVMVSGGAEIRFTPWFGVGARAQYAVSGGTVGRRALRTSLFSGGLHLRGWNDASRGLGWGLDIGLGYLLVFDELAASGLVLDVALLRLGGFGNPEEESAATGSLVLRAQQGIGVASDYRALFLGVEGGFEVYKPRSTTRRLAASFRYVLGGEGFIGVGIGQPDGRRAGAFAGGFGGFFGLPIGPVFEPRLRLDIARRASGDDGVDPFYSVLAGAGIRLRLDPWAPLYLEAHGGWAPGTTGLDGGFADLGGGLRLVSCDSDDHVAWVLGARGRIGFGDARGVTGVFAVLGVEWNGGPGFGVLPRCVEPTEALPTTPDGGRGSPTTAVDGAETRQSAELRPPPLPPPAAQPPLPPTPPRSEPAPSASRGSDTAGREASTGGGLRVPFGIEVEPLLGWVDAAVANHPFGGGIALGLDIDLSRAFSVYTRFSVVSAADVSTDDDGDFVDDVNGPGFTALAGTLGARLTLWTDPDDRQGWRFELGGGWRGRGSPRDSAGPMLEATVLREVGTVSPGGFAAGVGLGLRAHQGLLDAIDYRALFLVLNGYLAFSQDVAEPYDVPGRFSYRLGVHGGIGYSLSREGALIRGGLLTLPWGLHFGVPLGPWVEIRTSVDYVIRHVVPSRRDAMGMTVSGPEESLEALVPVGSMLLRLDRVVPMYVEAGLGYAAHFGAPAQHVRDGGVLVVGAGARFMGCGSDIGLDFGIQGRIGLGGNRADDAILFMTSADFAGGPRVIGDDAFWCRTFRSSAEEARRREAEQQHAHREGGVLVDGGGTEPSVGGGGDVRGGVTGVEVGRPVGGSVDVSVGGTIQVDVTPPAPPRPIEVEVLLGVSLFGGALDLRIDPRVLPLDRIRSAGRVEVRIVGPEHALASAEAQVRAAVGSGGKDLSAVVRVPSSDTRVRAIFVLYP